jgi:DNA-binding beta-propeller fold protein YncE
MKNLWLIGLAGISLASAPQALSQKLLTTIPLSGQPGLLAVNPTTNTIYVPMTSLGTVTVIDGNSNHLVTSIPAGIGPAAIAVNPVTNLVYVSNTGGDNQQDPSVIVIDGSSNTVVATVPAASPGFIAVNSTTNMIYFSNGGGASVSVLDGATNQITDTFATANCCLVQGIGINQATNRIYMVENGSSEQVVVIDGVTNKFASFPVTGACDLRGIAVDSTLDRVYVSDDICGNLYALSGATNKTIATVSGYFGPIALNSSNHVIAAFNFNVLGFVSERSNATTGGTVTFSRASSGLNLAASNNGRYYLTLRKANGVAVVSGPKGEKVR